MATRADSSKSKKEFRRCDEVPPGAFRQSEPTAALAAEPKPQEASPDLGDGQIPGTPAHALLEAEAGQLANVAPGTFLYGILAPFFNTSLDAYSYVVFMQKLVAQMAPADPLEQMAVEQMAHQM